MLVGLPGSGKSTYVKDMADGFTIISSDAIREELYGDVADQSHNKEVFDAVRDRTKTLLREEKSVILDATNITMKRRMAFLNELANIQCFKICWFFVTPYEKCLFRNSQRDRKVPEDVIRRMYLQFDIPGYNEGWNVVSYIRQYDIEDYQISGLFHGSDPEMNLRLISHDNPHHDLSIGDHCMLAASEILSRYPRMDDALPIAALLHDIGKPFVKDFHDANGNPTLEAHYYNHEHVSAYLAAQYTFSYNNSKHISELVRWHMLPFFVKEPKTEDKYRRMLGDELYNEVLLLHEADLAAH
jgi:predicted kinase